MSGRPMIRLMIADDHPVVREGLRLLLQQQRDMTIVAEADNGFDAVEAFRAFRPDVSIMDLRMPRCPGLEATIAIRREFPDSRILILTTYGGDEDVYTALRAGARGYLLKDCDTEQLITAIRTVYAGGRHIPAQVSRKLAERAETTELTAREWEVLRLIVRGLKNEMIATKLEVTVGTVKAHVNRILSKLDVDDRTQAVITALRRGMVSLDDE